MTAFGMALSVSALVTGLYLVAVAFTLRDPALSTGLSTRLWTSGRRWWRRRTRRERATWAAALVAGVVSAAVTGWGVLVLVVPLAGIVLPGLLRSERNRDIEILEALDRWIRLLAGSLPTGKSIPDAVRATARQVPPVLVAPVRLLVLRLDERWTTREALIALADDLDSADADSVVAALVLASERGGRGVVPILRELSDAVQHRLRALREVEAEREKPRVVVRQVTAITVVVLGGLSILNPQYFAPLASPLGQIILVGAVCTHLGSLVIMRRRARSPRRPRLLVARPDASRTGTPLAQGVGRG